MSGGTHERTETPYLRGIPLPTSGPLWAGFGVTMLFAGLVTHWMVSLVGLISATAGFIAWSLSCFPEESLEELPKGSEAVESAPQLARKAHAERVLLPAEMHPYGSGVRGGLIGGVAMAIVAILRIGCSSLGAPSGAFGVWPNVLPGEAAVSPYRRCGFTRSARCRAGRGR